MQTALKYNQDSPAVHLEMASLLEKSGNIQEAIEHAEEAAPAGSQDPDPHWLLANIYFRPQERGGSPGSMQKAIQELEKLKELTPDDERVYYALGGAYFELDKPEKAIQAYEKFQSLSTSADNGYREIAKYYERNGNEEKAIEYLTQGAEDSAGFRRKLWRCWPTSTRSRTKTRKPIPVYKKLMERDREAILRSAATWRASLIESANTTKRSRSWMSLRRMPRGRSTGHPNASRESAVRIAEIS